MSFLQTVHTIEKIFIPNNVPFVTRGYARDAFDLALIKLGRLHFWTAEYQLDKNWNIFRERCERLLVRRVGEMLGDHSCCPGWEWNCPRWSVISQSSGLVYLSSLPLRLLIVFIIFIHIYLLGWGATDRTGEQSRYPRQVDLAFNATSDCNCASRYFLQTNVGLNGEDTCEGDSGQPWRFSKNVEKFIPSYLYTWIPYEIKHSVEDNW